MKKMFLPLLVPTLLSVVACSPNNDSGVQNDAKPDAVQSSNFEAIYSGISDSDIRAPLKTLSSDEFEGRLPTTPGEAKTIEYLVNAFKNAGLQSGNGDSYLQKVALMEITADPDMTMTIGDNQFAYKKDMVAS